MIQCEKLWCCTCHAGCSSLCWWGCRSCGSPSSRPVKVASFLSTSSPSAPTSSLLCPLSSLWAAFGRGLTRRFGTCHIIKWLCSLWAVNCSVIIIISQVLLKCVTVHVTMWLSPLSQGAFWGLVVGLLVGCIRMLLDFIYPQPPCYEVDDRPGVLKYVHYLYFSILLSFITLVVVVVVSLATNKPRPEQVKPLYQF